MVDWLIGGLVQELNSFVPTQLDESPEIQTSKTLDLRSAKHWDTHRRLYDVYKELRREEDDVIHLIDGGGVSRTEKIKAFESFSSVYGDLFEPSAKMRFVVEQMHDVNVLLAELKKVSDQERAAVRSLRDSDAVATFKARAEWDDQNLRGLENKIVEKQIIIEKILNGDLPRIHPITLEPPSFDDWWKEWCDISSAVETINSENQDDLSTLGSLLVPQKLHHFAVLDWSRRESSQDTNRANKWKGTYRPLSLAGWIWLLIARDVFEEISYLPCAGVKHSRASLDCDREVPSISPVGGKPKYCSVACAQKRS